MFSFNNIWKPGSAVIVHLEFVQEGLKLHAEKVRLKENQSPAAPEAFDDLAAVIAKFGKNIPYLLHVDGTGVLTRLVEFLPGYREQLIVNGDKDDFYFSAFNDGFEVAVSFFRKSLIREQLDYLKQEKIYVVEITCGIIPVLAACGDKESITFDYSVQVDNGRIVKLKRAETVQERSVVNGSFRTRKEAIREGLSAIQQEASEQFSGGLEPENRKAALEEYGQYSKFRFFGILTVTVILSALIGNYFYLNHLNQETAQLEADLMLNNDNLSLLDRLRQEKIRKEQLITTSGVNASEFISFYIDKVGESVPKSISLKTAYFFPLKEKLKEKKKVEINQQAIEISGFTPNSEILDDWMEQMNRFDWIKSVELLNYLKSEHANAEFKLLITLTQ